MIVFFILLKIIKLQLELVDLPLEEIHHLSCVLIIKQVQQIQHQYHLQFDLNLNQRMFEILNPYLETFCLLGLSPNSGWVTKIDSCRILLDSMGYSVRHGSGRVGSGQITFSSGRVGSRKK